MQKAAPGDAGAMTAVLGLDDIAKIEELARRASAESRKYCGIANDNAPGQVVLSGHTVAIEHAEALAKEMGAKRAIRLEVAAAFHSPLMAPAAKEMERVLAELSFQPPRPAIFANVTATPVRDSDKIASLLVQQITGRVRWRESVAAMAAAGVDTQVEIGSGKVLTGLAKRIAPDMKTFAVETAADIEVFDTARKAR